MHPFILIPGLILFTASAVTAFGVFFAASKTTGLLKTFGNILGFWVLAMGVLAIVLATIGALKPRGEGRHFVGHRGGYHMKGAVAPPSIAPPASVAPAR
jgi:hypothetical protein